MNYSVYITKAAERDLEGAADYIEFVLLNVQAADDLLDEVEEKFKNLVDFPEANAYVNDPILCDWGIRFIPVKNYLAFYIVSGKTICIIRFLYKKRDWISILKQGISFE